MLQRTIYFGEAYYIHTRDRQLLIEQNNKHKASLPIEDLGSIILDHPQITLSTKSIDRLLDNNVSIVYCDEKHLPRGLLLPLYNHHTPNQRARFQLKATSPLKKQLWKQTIQSKINNQATVLATLGKNNAPLLRWSKQVKSGDTENKEAQASRYYWNKLFGESNEDFYRDRFGPDPNSLLNYGYTILRASVARALVASGLLPVIGIQHHNKYNPFCLADDIMEPYRPYVDIMVSNIVTKKGYTETILDKETKEILLQLDYQDVTINKKTKPMQLAIQKTTSSLAAVFMEERKSILYPVL